MVHFPNIVALGSFYDGAPFRITVEYTLGNAILRTCLLVLASHVLGLYLSYDSKRDSHPQ